ncbi:MAG: Hsp20/alpha crystallin family protein [Gillisia sp.]
MSLVKFNNRKFPWQMNGLTNWLDNDLFSDDFFTKPSDLPAMNVKEKDNAFEIELAVPGFSKKEIEVSLEDDVLHIRAEKRDETEEKDENFSRREFNYHSFERKLQMPPSVNKKEEIKATYKDGILNLKIAKSKEGKENHKKLISVE